jgi:hypothetical protein
MATLVFLYKLSHEIKVTYVQELIDALRYVGRTLLAARPLELAMGNVRSCSDCFVCLLSHFCGTSAHSRLGPQFSRAIVTDGIPRKSNAIILIRLSNTCQVVRRVLHIVRQECSDSIVDR